MQVALLRWYPANQVGSFDLTKADPTALAFDGASVWVTNALNQTVTKLRASDGAVLGSFPAGNAPSALAFDGANIWIADQGSDSVTQLRASDGAALKTFAAGPQPVGVAFDGANIW
ncbi:MAG TPA: hypothetical protein VN648_17675, partial [Candidatus Methylomirabilis sp.]|nr:hypothetical protein [Candidatus Methylomirabilis sp.]